MLETAADFVLEMRMIWRDMGRYDGSQGHLADESSTTVKFR